MGPMAKGTVQLPVDIQLSSLIPASLATTSTHVTAVSDTGDKLVCLDVNTAKEAELMASAVDLAVTYADCGDASTHAQVTDLQPSKITSGQTNTLTGTGSLDEDVNGATFSAVVKAQGVQVASCNGDASQDVTCQLPLGTGSITLKKQTFPMAKGTVELPVDIQLSSLIPASLATTSTHVTAVSDTGDKLVCLDVNTAKVSEILASAVDLAVTYADCGD